MCNMFYAICKDWVGQILEKNNNKKHEKKKQNSHFPEYVIYKLYGQCMGAFKRGKQREGENRPRGRNIAYNFGL